MTFSCDVRWNLFLLERISENSENSPVILKTHEPKSSTTTTPKIPKILKICQKFLKKKVFFEALILYRIEKKTLISYRYRIESKKSLSLFIGRGTISWKHVQSFVCHNFQLQYTFQIFSWSLLILFWYYHICQTTLALKLYIDQITLLPGENKDHHGFQDQKFRVTLIRLLGLQTVQRLGGHQNIHIKLINHWFINLFAYYLEPGEHRWSWGHL